MNSKQLLSIIFIMMTILMNGQALDIICNKKTELKMDRDVTRLMVIGQRNLKFPTNPTELRRYCNYVLKTLDTITEYSNKCLPAFGRESSKIFLHSLSVEMKAICKPGKLSRRARELLETTPCANAGLKNWQRCYEVVVDKLTGVEMAPVKQRLPMSCCNFHQYIECLTNEAEEVKKCTKKTIDYIVKYMHKIIDPFLLVLCNEYSEPSDRCDRLVTLTPNRTDEQQRYKSFLMPMINIAYSIGDEVLNEK